MSLPLAITWGPGEILIVLAVMLLLFGGKRLPGLARSLGSSVTEFKKGIRGESGKTDSDEEARGDQKKPIDSGSDPS